MRKLNKLISVLLCTVMFITIGFTGIVSADNDIMFDLKSLGILGGFGFEDHLDSNITRAEFAQLVVNMMNQKQVANTMESASYFNDIADSPYKGAINLLYKEEIVAGTGNGTFEPNRNVRYTEACKMLVKALGYHVIVSDTSLASYTFLAGTIGVTANVDSSKEYITVRDMLVMVDNCLDIGRMIPMYYNTNMSPSYIIDEDDTFRSSFNIPAPEGTVRMEGIVTADVSTYLYTDRKGLKKNQLEISGQVFAFDGVAPLGFVGKHVYFYVKKNADGEYGNVVSISPSNKNTVVNIYGRDLASYSNEHMKFYVSDTKTSEIETNLTTKWIYNGVPGNYCLDSVDMDGNVHIMAVDNNEDDIFDTVFVYEYIDAIVESVNAESEFVTFETGYYFRNEKNICFNEDEEDVAVTYFDKDGNSANFSAIKSGSVLSIAKSNDGRKICIYITNESGTALAEGIDGDYITLGTAEYLCHGIDGTSFKVGRNYDYKINFMNRLVYAKEVVVKSDYAYTYQLSSGTGFKAPRIKLIIPEKVASKTIQGTYDEENNQTTSSTNLYIRNSNVLVYNLASKVTLEYWASDSETDEVYLAKEKVTPDSENLAKMMNRPVSFEVDENNNIKRLSHITESSVGGTVTYNSSEKVFGKSSLVDPFMIDDNTYAVCVPTNDASEDDMLNYIQELLNNKQYAINAYDVDEDTHIADLLVINAEMISGSAGVVSASRTCIGIIKKASRVYNEKDGSESIKITMITKNNEKSVMEQSFIVSPLISAYESFYNISAGDLIEYSLDGFDRLNGYHMLRKSTGYFDTADGVQTSRYVVIGEVTDLDYNEISNKKLRVADLITIENIEGNFTYELYHNASLCPTVYILNSGSKEVELGSVSDIKFGDYILLYAYAGDPYAIVIYR